MMALSHGFHGAVTDEMVPQGCLQFVEKRLAVWSHT